MRIRSAIHIKPPITMRSVPFLTDSWVITGTDPETIPLTARALAEVAGAYDCSAEHKNDVSDNLF